MIEVSITLIQNHKEQKANLVLQSVVLMPQTVELYTNSSSVGQNDHNAPSWWKRKGGTARMRKKNTGI